MNKILILNGLEKLENNYILGITCIVEPWLPAQGEFSKLGSLKCWQYIFMCKPNQYLGQQVRGSGKVSTRESFYL